MLQSKMDLHDALQVASTSRTYVINSTVAALAVTLERYQNNVKVHTTADHGNITITTPHCAVCKGDTFAIEFVTLGDDETVTIVGAGGLNWSNIVLTAAGDRAVLRSSGTEWEVLEDVST